MSVLVFPVRLSSAEPWMLSNQTGSPTSVAPTSSIATPTGPSPIQSGIAPDCVTYYQAQSGDSCWSVVNEKYTYLTQDKFVESITGSGSPRSRAMPRR